MHILELFDFLSRDICLKDFYETITQSIYNFKNIIIILTDIYSFNHHEKITAFQLTEFVKIASESLVSPSG